MKRRDFFKLGFQKATDVIVEEAEVHVEQKARQWIRPPYAVGELDFLLKCTRCGACEETCPHEVIFPLPAKYGLEAVSTPAMDLLETGCRLCHDWPCVQACETGALSILASGEKNSALPTNPISHKIADVHISEDLCLPYLGPECGACAASCPVEGALLWDGPKPSIDQELCTGCAMCREACIAAPKAIGVRSVASAS